MTRRDVQVSACARLVRERDPDRYFCALLAPPDHREALMALEAFDLELAQVPARVSEPMLGSIRFQCWREALADLAAGNVSRHKVVLALDRAGRDHGLDPSLLVQAIDARDDDLSRGELATLDDLVALARGGRDSVMALGLHLLGGAGAALETAGAAAVACELAARLSNASSTIPYCAPVLPRDVLARHGLTLGALLDVEAGHRMSDATREVAERAHVAVDEVVRMARRLPRPAGVALLPVAFARHDLWYLGRRGCRMFDTGLPRRGVGSQLAVIARWLVGRP